MEEDNYEVFAIVRSQSPQPLYGEIDITKFNKNTIKTLICNKFMYLLYQSTALLLPFVRL